MITASTPGLTRLLHLLGYTLKTNSAVATNNDAALAQTV